MDLLENIRWNISIAFYWYEHQEHPYWEERMIYRLTAASKACEELDKMMKDKKDV